MSREAKRARSLGPHEVYLGSASQILYLVLDFRSRGCGERNVLVDLVDLQPAASKGAREA
jgi:hypothetical protein